jgi:hypothetical protein
MALGLLTGTAGTGSGFSLVNFLFNFIFYLPKSWLIAFFFYINLALFWQ